MNSLLEYIICIIQDVTMVCMTESVELLCDHRRVAYVAYDRYRLQSMHIYCELQMPAPPTVTIVQG